MANNEDFFNSKEDFGSEPASEPMSDANKRLVAVFMAVNATLLQFVNEGVLPAEEQMHFMNHFQDFVNRIYKGEALTFSGVKHTLNVNSRLGSELLGSVDNMLEHGHEQYIRVVNMVKQMQAQMEAETTEAASDYKPLDLQSPEPKRTLH